jgi:hypothetical protein
MNLVWVEDFIRSPSLPIPLFAATVCAAGDRFHVTLHTPNA